MTHQYHSSIFIKSGLITGTLCNRNYHACYNFSPSLGETGTVKIAIAPDITASEYSNYWLKVEIVRETINNNEQHIDWINMGEGNIYSMSRPIELNTHSFKWSGVLDSPFSSAASQATGRDVFQGVYASTNRIFPAAIQGQAMPPPFVTAVAKVLHQNGGVQIAEARKRIFIPQVVRIEYEEAAVTQLCSSIWVNFQNNPTMLFAPMNAEEWNLQKNRIKTLAQFYYDSIQTNIRFCDDSMTVTSPFSKMMMIATETGVFGYAGNDFLNCNIEDQGRLLSDQFVQSVLTYYINNPTAIASVTANEMGNLWALTLVHEVGHLLGLVENNNVLNGDRGCHNKDITPRRVMNCGTVDDLPDNFGRHGSWSWKQFNAEYLKFVLPNK